jgi:hypothetical protein
VTFGECAFVCAVCDYQHYNYTNFSKHTKWYYLHAALKDSSFLPMLSSADISESSKVAFGMMSELSVDESAQHWQQHRRPHGALPQKRQMTSLVRPILPAPIKFQSQLCPAVPSFELTVPDASQDVLVVSEKVVLGDPSTSLSASIPVLQSSAASLSAPPSKTLKQDEVAVLSEFLIFDDTSEFDKESSTRNVATNISPLKEHQTEAETQYNRSSKIKKGRCETTLG